jgi:hypothetical protein
MSHLLQAAEFLQKTETRLRDLVAKAAAEGDYASVMQITSWAKALRELLEKKDGANANGVDITFRNGHSTAAAEAKRARPSSGKQERRDYPRFFRRGEDLVRVAWSRRAKSEYQHKTSENILKVVAENIASVGREGRVFSTEEILPVRDRDGSEVPAYQTYVCIALLKMTGVLDQHGRQGYSIVPADDFIEVVDGIWRKLPSSK